MPRIVVLTMAGQGTHGWACDRRALTWTDC
jgi:hypothetical protein